jgi:hypothetical protein
MKRTILMGLIAAAFTTIVSLSAIPPTLASTDEDPASNGLEVADENVHDNTGPVSDQDVRFHEGTCQGGHTTEALEGLGGCDILSDPGNSDNHRQDN